MKPQTASDDEKGSNNTTSQSGSNNTESKPNIQKPASDDKESKLNIQQPLIAAKRKIQRVDRTLYEYYKQCKGEEYVWFNDDGVGKFEAWCDDNDYDTEAMDGDIGDEDLDDATFLEFDKEDEEDNFPIDERWALENTDHRRKRKFEIMKLAHSEIPANIWVWIEDFNFELEEKNMMDTFNLYDEYITEWGNEAKMDLNTLHFLACSMKNNQENLLMDLVDIYKRDTVEVMFKEQLKDVDTDVVNQDQNGEDKRFEKWIKKYAIIDKLRQKYDQHKRQYDTDELEQKILEKVSTGKIQNKSQVALDFKLAMLTYIKRIGHRLLLNGNLANDDYETITTYIHASREFITLAGFPGGADKAPRLNGPPFMIDFIIVLPPSVRDEKFPMPSKANDDDDDSDDEDDDDNKNENKNEYYKYDIIGDIPKHLEATGTVYHKVEVHEKDLWPIRAQLKAGLEDFKKKLNNIDTKTYPQHQRINVIIDRREAQKDKPDTLIIFQPPDECNKIPNEQIPPEIYFDLSRRCLIPRSESVTMPLPVSNQEDEKKDSIDAEHFGKITTESLNATTAASGQLMTFSYHARAKDDIKCYLLWNGQNHRFYPQDMVEILPQIFKSTKESQEFVNGIQLKQRIKQIQKEKPFSDERFERFYGKLKQNRDFPKQYKDVEDPKYPEIPKVQQEEFNQDTASQ